MKEKTKQNIIFGIAIMIIPMILMVLLSYNLDYYKTERKILIDYKWFPSNKTLMIKTISNNSQFKWYKESNVFNIEFKGLYILCTTIFGKIVDITYRYIDVITYNYWILFLIVGTVDSMLLGYRLGR